MKRAPLYLLALVVVVGFVMLGRWQLQRAAYKEQLIAQSREVLERRIPMALAIASDADAHDFAWVAGEGRFLPRPALLLDNQTRNGQQGVRVYRLFQPDDARHPLLVELGWRPLPPQRILPHESVLDGRYRLQGLLAPPPSPGLALGVADQTQADGSHLLTRIDINALAKSLALPGGLAPRVLRLDPALALGYVRDLDVLTNTLPPSRHRGYALQWFAMAAAVGMIALVFLFRRKPE
jgi:cytochrome oxidase assembly protein ShyY1